MFNSYKDEETKVVVDEIEKMLAQYAEGKGMSIKIDNFNLSGYSLECKFEVLQKDEKGIVIDEDYYSFMMFPSLVELQKDDMGRTFSHKDNVYQLIGMVTPKKGKDRDKDFVKAINLSIPKPNSYYKFPGGYVKEQLELSPVI